MKTIVKNIISNFFYGAVLLIIVFSSCKKNSSLDDEDIYHSSDDSIAIASSKNRPGLGDNDEDPAGTPWILPPNIRIVERPHYRFNPDINKLYGHVNFFYVDINLVNDNMPGTAPVIVEFPPGLVVISTEHDKQNGLSTERFFISVPPTQTGTGGRDTTTIYLGVACLNYGRSMPWYDNEGEELNYPISRNNFHRFTVTTDPNLKKLLAELKDKPGLRLTQHWNPMLAHEEDYITPEWMKIYNLISDMIWNVTDGPGITNKELRELRKKLEPYR